MTASCSPRVHVSGPAYVPITVSAKIYLPATAPTRQQFPAAATNALLRRLHAESPSRRSAWLAVRPRLPHADVYAVPDRVRGIDFVDEVKFGPQPMRSDSFETRRAAWRPSATRMSYRSRLDYSRSLSAGGMHGNRSPKARGEHLPAVLQEGPFIGRFLLAFEAVPRALKCHRGRARRPAPWASRPDRSYLFLFLIQARRPRSGRGSAISKHRPTFCPGWRRGGDQPARRPGRGDQA